MNSKNDKFPLVSIVIPMFNEIVTIEKCIGSVLNQDYPQEQIEIVVVDGGSIDGSTEKVRELAATYSNIRLLENPRRVTPAALNIGIKNARGEIIIILGAHTRIKEDFIRQNVIHMQRMNVKCVGGTQINVGEDFIQKAIAYAMGSPFGLPSAPYRFWKKEKFVDTVVYAAYKKELFDEIGYFDEELLISEDAELNWRIRKAGHKIFYTPKIVSYYYPRRSIAGLVKQLFRYGILRVNVIKKHRDAVKLVHLLPLIFLSASIALFVLGLFHSLFMYFLFALWLCYFLGIITASLTIAVKAELKFLTILPLIFIAIHLSWSIGFVVGIFISHKA